MGQRLGFRLLLVALLPLAACRGGGARGDAGVPASQTFRAAVAAVLPSVVYIQVEAHPPTFGDLQPALPDPQESAPELSPRMAAGSGVFLTGDGYILTSDHVVQQADRVMVTLHDRRRFDARVVARDPSTDVAVVKIDGHGFPAPRFGDSDHLALGDWVLALGSPLGLQFSVTAGVVSAIGRTIGILGAGGADGPVRTAPLEHFIQTDAAINPGNSGGPLVNLAGEVVGINTAIASPTGYFSGYGFAVPIALARRVADQLIRYGHVRRAYLGALLNDLDPADVKVYGLQNARGAEIVGVQPGSPAAQAGLRPGDVVIGIGTDSVGTVSDLQAALAAIEPGSETHLEVLRYGDRLTVPVTLGLIRSGVKPDPPPPLEGPARVGFSVSERGGEVRVAVVRPYSAAARAGVRAGQIVREVNRTPIHSAEDFVEAVRKSSNGAVSLLVDDTDYGTVIINYEPRP
jgi:serine protease Do